MIIVHCSDGPGDTFESIKAFHTRSVDDGGRGWRDIGYHLVIESNGAVQFGRPEEQAGAHCAGYNQESIGVCLTGRFISNKDEYTDAQIDSLITVVTSLVKKYGLSEKFVFAHYELKQGKSCPNFPGNVLRALIKERLKK